MPVKLGDQTMEKRLLCTTFNRKTSVMWLAWLASQRSRTVRQFDKLKDEIGGHSPVHRLSLNRPFCFKWRTRLTDEPRCSRPCINFRLVWKYCVHGAKNFEFRRCVPSAKCCVYHLLEMLSKLPVYRSISPIICIKKTRETRFHRYLAWFKSRVEQEYGHCWVRVLCE